MPPVLKNKNTRLAPSYPSICFSEYERWCIFCLFEISNLMPKQSKMNNAIKQPFLNITTKIIFITKAVGLY